jgi:hypothetical protein
MPIASSRQAEEYINIKKVSNFILGEQLGNFHVKYPKTYRVSKTANINGKKLFSLQPVVRTRGYYKRVGLIKRQKSFQGLAT